MRHEVASERKLSPANWAVPFAGGFAVAIGLAAIYDFLRARDAPFGERQLGSSRDIQVMNTGQARVYDPDARVRHTPHGALDTRRDLATRA